MTTIATRWPRPQSAAYISQSLRATGRIVPAKLLYRMYRVNYSISSSFPTLVFLAKPRGYL